MDIERQNECVACGNIPTAENAIDCFVCSARVCRGCGWFSFPTIGCCSAECSHVTMEFYEPFDGSLCYDRDTIREWVDDFHQRYPNAVGESVFRRYLRYRRNAAQDGFYEIHLYDDDFNADYDSESESESEDSDEERPVLHFVQPDNNDDDNKTAPGPPPAA